ncbi:SNF2-related protein [Pseudactinotalea sp. HY160]|uniref:SNF2-related protein n=1 Tax=Pseudactinotalea sp. HY160 TaxID=2654490 RepID=UPI00351BE192
MLAEALGLTATTTGGGTDTATLALPSLLTAPLDSPDVVRVRPRPAPRTEPALTAWTVPILILDPVAALAFLDLDVDDPFDDVRLGESVWHLAEVAALARDLAERGRVLPTVSLMDDARGLAWWRPVEQGPDARTVAGLVSTLPPVGRAVVADPADLTGRHPATLVESALDQLTDAAVRARLEVTGTPGLAGVPRRRGRLPKTIPAAEAWLDALGTADGEFTAEAGDLERLAASLAAWDEFGAGAPGRARATFRLVSLDDLEDDLDGLDGLDGLGGLDDDDDDDGLERSAAGVRPAGGAPGARWRLQFWLQSAEDPTLMVPASQVWDGGEGLARWLDRPDELLLAELGRAATVYPDLAAALRRARPVALDLDATGAHDFLAHRADLLDQAGFGVLLPSWWQQRRRLGLKATAAPQVEGGVSAGMLTAESLVDFDWRLALGEETLSEEELAALAAAKEPLVRLRGQWVAVDAEQIRLGLEFIARRREAGPQHSVAQILALAASHHDAEAPLPVTAVHASGLLGDLLEGTADTALAPVCPPPGLHAELRPYQERGLAWLSFLDGLGLGACLADDMGLGKTIQLLALELHARAQRPESGPTLLLCPMSLIGNWQREAARFAPGLTLYAHHGPTRPRGKALAQRLASCDVVLTTYHTATRDIDDLATHDWGRLVLDEAQAVKNHLTRAGKAVRRLDARHRVALTGTPMENKLAELWSIMDLLNPGILGSIEQFRTRFAKPIERQGLTEPAARLRQVTRPYILRRLKTDPQIAPDLPEKIEIKQYCNLTREQASLYQSVVAEMMPKIEAADGIARRGNVLATMTKLKQVCNHPAQLLHDGSPVAKRSGKVARLHEILAEIIGAGEKALLFTQYTEFADMLLPHLAAAYGSPGAGGSGVLYLHGGTPRFRRDELVQRFQDPGGPGIFLLSLKAGGTGLNLTAASHVLHLDRWWNPAVENQATDRAFRIGQRRNVQVRKFICAGTLEERIDEMIERKRELADLVVGGGESWISDLSTEELRRVFTLSEEAIGE